MGDVLRQRTLVETPDWRRHLEIGVVLEKLTGRFRRVIPGPVLFGPWRPFKIAHQTIRCHNIGAR